MSSNRLPGKVLKLVVNKPMLELQLERLARSRKLDRLVVATSLEQSDNPIEDLCDKYEIDCFRGSLDDVLDRFYQTARQYKPDVIVRLTGDCPLTDPDVIDMGIEFFQSHDYDYVSNSVERTFPIGLDMEVFSHSHLKAAWKKAILPSEREHVTAYFRNRPEKYKIGQFHNTEDLSHHRWTVDEPADYEFVKAVYEHLYPVNPTFSSRDILELLEKKPALMSLNYSIVHGEGYIKSLKDDEEYIKKEKQFV